MFWTANKDKTSIDVRRIMGRLLNRHFTASLNEPEHETRRESRSRVTLPVIVVAISDDANQSPNIKTGVSHDVSCEGMSILSEHPIPHGEVIIGFGPLDDWHALRGTCLRTTSFGYGFIQSGMHIDEILSPSEYQPIKEYAAQLELRAIEKISA